MLNRKDGSEFTTGKMKYEYRALDDGGRDMRILIPVRLDDAVTILAMLDTGSSYVVVAPQFASLVGQGEDLGKMRLQIRGVYYGGRIQRVTIGLVADEGSGLDVDATAFVVDPAETEVWGKLPCFVGVAGCLERVRIAIDPGEDVLHFGAV